MKKILTLPGFAILVSVLCGEASEKTTSSPELVLFLTADGFRTDYIEWYHPAHLEALIADGVRVTRATNVFPTVTTPNMTALVTGAYPRTSGIGGNTQYEKESDRLVSSPRDNSAETIGETLRKAGWHTAAVNHFMLQNRGAEFYSAAGYDNGQKTTDQILEMIEKNKVRFVAAIYGAADHAGHAHGPHSDEVKQAVLSIDAEIGRLMDGLKRLGLYDKTVLVFNADHGMSDWDKKNISADPARVLKDAGFKVYSGKGEFPADTEVLVVDEGGRVIYFRNVEANRQREARQLLSEIKGAEVLGRKELDALGCHDDRSGDLIVSPLPGYVVRNAGKAGGLHGRFAERNPVLIFHGPGFKKGITIPGAQTIDVVPTLLRLMNVPPSLKVDGKVIEAALVP